MSAADAWRCFVAVPIDDALRSALGPAVAGWRRAPQADDLRWADAGSWHVTLAFLGATDPGRVGDLAERLATACAGREPFALATGGVGGFPSRRRARVAWYGVDDPDGALAGLAAAVREALDLQPSPFRAHLTLARARGAEVDVSWLAAGEAPAGRLVVDRVALFRSHLGRGPARHEVLASVPLRSPVRA